MRVVRAERYAGFCGGVRRAWQMAERELEASPGPIYLSGELIHNRPAMAELEARGVCTISVLEEQAPRSGTLVLRAHGEGPQVYATAQALQLRVVDATCRIVKRVQRRAQELEQEGFQVILYGHKAHPEARATVAYTRSGFIVESAEEAGSLPHYAKIAAIAQTTVLASEYRRVCEVLRRKCDVFVDEGEVCRWTRHAQEEAVSIARQVEAMVVVGGKNSSNTRRLAEVCSACCPTYHVETAEELEPAWFAGVESVGVTAGASTRDRDLEAVVARLESLNGHR